MTLSTLHSRVIASTVLRTSAFGYVEVEKTFIDRKPHTIARMRRQDHEALERYREEIGNWLATDMS